MHVHMAGDTRQRSARPSVRGKFLHAGDRKLYLRGVTYGTFRPAQDGSDYPAPAVVERDFASMAAAGVNAVRVYTPAPRWLLDLALEHELRVMAGLPWEQHVAFLEQRGSARSIERRVREAVRGMAGHPALLAYSIGNEIPGGIARWHGRAATERFIERLFYAAKDEDPGALVTYVNFPTTEYLQLPFVDFVTFNVYLEQPETLQRYLARLHNIAGERPLVMAEIGLDSRRNGEDVQAAALERQVGTAFELGCAGAFVFAWTDEWHRGGYDIDDWDFGLVTRDRRPKPALAAVSRTFDRLHRGALENWPPITVAVCSHNGERWLPGCLQALQDVSYPNFEVVVVSDGSTDTTEAIARHAGVRVVSHPENRGLSAARNSALAAARGEIIAYVDDDARPDQDWLHYIALAFARSDHVAVGGPNIAPPKAGDVEDAIANAPGGPVHILLDDVVAEHVPGCNLAVRTEALRAIGGFDERFRIAGDDVDLCWRLQASGATIGFNPGAMVWHHRRPSVLEYLRQQRNYGRAEALLERKWPERYNRLGHLNWTGRIYGAGARMHRVGRRARIGYGTWGSALFQSIYQPAPTVLRSIALMPEWYLVLGLLAVVSGLGFLWTPLLLAAPLLVAGVTLVVVNAFRAADRRHDADYRRLPFARRLRLRTLTTGLHVAQPMVRLVGRMDAGLSPWRRRAVRSWAVPRRRTLSVWSEQWASLDEWLARIEARLDPEGHALSRGAYWDRWDLQVRDGPFGVARLLCVIEEHGAGRQLVRFRVWPVVSRGATAAVLICGVAAALALAGGSMVAAAVLGALAVIFVLAMAYDCALGIGALVEPCSLLAQGTRPADDPPVARVVPDLMARFDASKGGGRRQERLGAAYGRDGDAVRHAGAARDGADHR